MYLGLLLLLIGWAVWLGSVSPWLVLPLFVIVLTVVQIIPEEQALGKRFGEPYLLTNGAWRDGLAGVGDAMLDWFRSASVMHRCERVQDNSAQSNHQPTSFTLQPCFQSQPRSSNNVH